MIGDKPWFIEFYSPGCPHCQDLQPAWTELHLKHKEELNVAKVDCTTFADIKLCNLFTIQSFPTLAFLPAHSNTYHKYDRPSRELAELEAFALEGGWQEARELEIGA